MDKSADASEDSCPRAGHHACKITKFKCPAGHFSNNKIFVNWTSQERFDDGHEFRALKRRVAIEQIGQ